MKERWSVVMSGYRWKGGNGVRLSMIFGAVIICTSVQGSKERGISQLSLQTV